MEILFLDICVNGNANNKNTQMIKGGPQTMKKTLANQRFSPSPFLQCAKVHHCAIQIAPKLVHFFQKYY